MNSFVLENNNTSEMKLSGHLKVKVYKIFSQQCWVTCSNSARVEFDAMDVSWTLASYLVTDLIISYADCPDSLQCKPGAMRLHSLRSYHIVLDSNHNSRLSMV